MSDSHSNRSLPSVSSSSCDDYPNDNGGGNVSTTISTPCSNTVTVNGTVVSTGDVLNTKENTEGSVEDQVTLSSNENHEQTVTIVTATVATATVKSSATKAQVKQRGEKLVSLQRVSEGSVPSHRQHLGGPVKQQSGPAAIMATGSGRSSVSSLASSSAGTTNSSSTSCCCNGAAGAPQLQQQQSLNTALAIVANKWDREQRIQDQENIRRLTLLKQRKISAILKKETLQKSLKSSSLNSMGSSNGSMSGNDLQNPPITKHSVQNQLIQVKELEEEVAAVDNEMAHLGEEQEQNLRDLNQKRVQHITTLQQMGLLGDSLSCSIDDPYGAGRWRSEIDLKGGNSGVTSPRANSASGQTSNNSNHTNEETVARKISPPLAAVLASSRIRSGSDPSLALSCEDGAVDINPGYYSSTKRQDENRKPSTQSTGSGKNRSLVGKSPGASPKTTGRRNPLRMLSNAIDFRVRTKKLMSQHHSRKNDGNADSKSSSRLHSFDFGRNRPKSADFDRVVSTISENPDGQQAGEEEPNARQVPISISSVDLGYSSSSSGAAHTLKLPRESKDNKVKSNTLQLHSKSKPLYYTSAISLTTDSPVTSTDIYADHTCAHHRQISTEQINMLVTPDAFPLNTISPTSPRAPAHGVSPTSLASRLLNGTSFSPFSLATSRHSLPNLDPEDMEDAINQAKLSPYTTNPRRKGGRHKHHAGSSQLSSLNISNNKFAMMTHAISDPIPEQQTTHSPSAITSVPPTPNSYIEIQQENGKCMNSQFYSPNYVHPPPLENRNSAPEIVVLSPGRELPQVPIHQEKPSKKSYNTHGVEDRINRAKAKVLHKGGLFRSTENTAYCLDDELTVLPTTHQYEPSLNTVSPGPCSAGSGHVRQKLSTRFHSAQKLNYKLAALSSFASAASANINVRRSRTFNISDVHDQLTVGASGNNGGGISGNIYDIGDPTSNTSYYTKTLPKQMKTSSGNSPRKIQTMRKLDTNTLTVAAGARDSNSSASSGVCCGSYSSDITTTTTGSSNGTGSIGELGSGASSTASSRKSSNSSSKDEPTIGEDETGTEIRTNISEDALKEIAAFESFIASYVVQQAQPAQTHHHTCCSSKLVPTGDHNVSNTKHQVAKTQLALPSLVSNKTGIPPIGPRGRRMIATGGVVRTLERQKKITSMSSQNSEEA